MEKCKDDIPQFIDTENITALVYGDTHSWREKEVFKAELQVLKCEDCGRESISWKRI